MLTPAGGAADLGRYHGRQRGARPQPAEPLRAAHVRGPQAVPLRVLVLLPRAAAAGAAAARARLQPAGRLGARPRHEGKLRAGF